MGHDGTPAHSASRSRSRSRAGGHQRHGDGLESSHRLVPVLRLVTGGSAAETRMSGARAGRGAVELGLPEEPTVSREHARFTFSDGQWWISNLGMNGLTLNGALLGASSRSAR